MIFLQVMNKEDAEEITQDTIIGALQNMNHFNEKSSLKTWVYSIALNKIKDYLKYKNSQKRQANSLEWNIFKKCYFTKNDNPYCWVFYFFDSYEYYGN